MTGVARALGNGLAEARSRGDTSTTVQASRGRGGGGTDVEGAQLHGAQDRHIMVNLRRDPHGTVGRHDPGRAGGADADGTTDRIGKLRPGVMMGGYDHVRR
jgi:hypothetical protein